jgi:hypothetical protein
MMRIKDNSDGSTEFGPFRFRISSLAASIQDSFFDLRYAPNFSSL